MSSTQPEKKNRLSRLLGGKRDKSPIEPVVPPDSAYASSEHSRIDPKMDRSTSEIVPAEKNSDIANIDKDRNLGLRPSTGEVFDQDTGEMVTVVTTTTTTTTTTTRKPGAGAPEIHKDVKQDVQESTTSPNTAPVSSSAGPVSSSAAPIASSPIQSGPAEMPANTTMTPLNQTSAPHSSVPDRASSKPTTMTAAAPSIPHKSLARKSGEYGTSAQAGPVDENLTSEPPLSPSGRHNFSYPQRNRNSMDPDGSNLMTTSEPQRHNKSTISDLKAAAKGIHGIGETLRGTLNSTIDEQFPRKNPNKAAAAQMKNEAVLNRGRSEVSQIPSSTRSDQPLDPGRHEALHVPSSTRPDQPRTQTGEQVIPGQWRDDGLDHEKAPSPAAYGGDGEAALGEDPPETRKARSIGKLFKRKPVGGGGGELREETSKSRERKNKYY